MCVHEQSGVYQQLDWGCSLKSSSVQVPATEETGIKGQLLGLTEVLTAAAEGDPPCNRPSS